LERVCRNLDLGFTADALIPNEHRGRLNLLEFQRYFARLPDSIIFNETSTSSYESLKKKGETIEIDTKSSSRQRKFKLR
jgi:hypothetical protein